MRGKLKENSSRLCVCVCRFNQQQQSYPTAKSMQSKIMKSQGEKKRKGKQSEQSESDTPMTGKMSLINKY